MDKAARRWAEKAIGKKRVWINLKTMNERKKNWVRGLCQRKKWKTTWWEIYFFAGVSEAEDTEHILVHATRQYYNSLEFLPCNLYNASVLALSSAGWTGKENLLSAVHQCCVDQNCWFLWRNSVITQFTLSLWVVPKNCLLAS